MKTTIFAIILTAIVSSCQLNGKAKSNMENDTTQSSDSIAGNNTGEQKQPAVPFPLNSGFSDEYLKATFWKCNYSSAGPEHAYWVILPNTIKPTSVDPEALPQVGLTNIGIYNVIDKTLPYIEVWVAYETVDGKQTPAEWLLNKLRITGEKVLNQNEINYPDGQKNLDVLTAKTIGNGERVISRFTGVSKGKNYFVLKATANEKVYASQANTIFHIVSHWGLK